MSTSEFGYPITLDTTRQLAANEPADVDSVAALLNNVNHLSDEFGQVRVAWSDPGLLTTYPNVSGWVQLTYFEFPILQRQNGDSYRFRIRLGGYATGGAVVKFRAVISGPEAVASIRGGFGDQDFITTTASGSNAWLTGSSQGALASGTLIYLPASRVGALVVPTPPLLGGVDTSITIAAARLTIYGITDKAGSDPPRLGGVLLAEYIGT